MSTACLYFPRGLTEPAKPFGLASTKLLRISLAKFLSDYFRTFASNDTSESTTRYLCYRIYMS